jgi:molybdopterin synthase sulfur carrier subunit
MSIRIRFFASLRESTGQAEASIEASDAQNVLDVWALTTNHMEMPGNTLCAINMEYVDAQQSVQDGDEVAFFPPVTGG